MTRTLTALAAAALVAGTAIATPTPADARGGWFPGAIIGGLAAGIVVGALAPRYYYGGGPYYYGGGPYYYGGGPYYAAAPYGYSCLRHRRVWTGHHWAVRRVRVC
jgi:hypothetical protein